MDEIKLSQIIRDLLDKNDQSLNPVSIIANTEIAWDNDRPVLIIETITMETFVLRLEKQIETP